MTGGQTSAFFIMMAAIVILLWHIRTTLWKILDELRKRR